MLADEIKCYTRTRSCAAYYIYRVICQNGDRILFERLSTLRSATRITLESRWHTQQHKLQEQQHSESASSCIWKQVRSTSVSDQEKQIKVETTDNQCSTGVWKQMRDTVSSVE